MTQISGRTFEMIKDRDASLSIEGACISQCVFDNCTFSNESISVRRSVIKNVTAEKCKFIGCQIGPGVFKDCHLKDSTATDLVIFWGSIFENVVLSGRVPAIKINTEITFGPDLNLQSEYDNDRGKHYDKINYAIDISDARFTVFEARGIPARLFKLDHDTQAIVRRENFRNISNISDLESNAWYPWISLFATNGEADLVLATPLSKPKAKRDQFLAGIVELRNRGIADPA